MELREEALGEGREDPHVPPERRGRAVDREVLPILRYGLLGREPFRRFAMKRELALEAPEGRLRLLLSPSGDETHPVGRLAVGELPDHRPAPELLLVDARHAAS